MDEHEPVPGAVAATAEPDVGPAPRHATAEELAVAARDDVIVDLRGDEAVLVAAVVDPATLVLDELPAWPELPVRDTDADVATGEVVIEVGRGDVVEVLPAVTVTTVPAVRAVEGDGPAWLDEPAPRWRTTQLAGAIAAALVLGLVGGLLVGRVARGGERASSAPVVDRTSVTVASDAPAPTTRLVPRTPSAAETAASAAVSTGPGSWQDPLPIGARATLRDPAKGDLEIVVIGVDADPWPELVAANSFNTPAPANLRFVMATVAVIFHAGTETRTFEGVSGSLVFSAFGSAAREHRDTDHPVIAPLALDRAADLLDGGSVYGNLVFAIEADSTDASLRVQRTACSTTCGELWFRLR